MARAKIKTLNPKILTLWLRVHKEYILRPLQSTPYTNPPEKPKHILYRYLEPPNLNPEALNPNPQTLNP